jgi:uncharacterized protein (DUF2141 family)
MKLIPAHLAVMACITLAQAASAADLNLDIKVPADKPGAVRVALFDRAEGFPSGKAHRTAIAMPVDGKAQVQFTGLAPGQYAITAFLDENGNAVFDKNVFGMPTESYGFSRDARSMTGPPAFADAAFSVGETALSQSFQLK